MPLCGPSCRGAPARGWLLCTAASLIGHLACHPVATRAAHAVQHAQFEVSKALNVA
jgi:hypothetical protein